MARRSPLALALTLALLAAACGGGADDSATDGGNANETAGGDAESLLVYSGRNKNLVQPILDRFEEETDIPVEVRYGDTAEMASTIIEEGDNSPADVFFGQDAGALGALADEDRFQALDTEVIEQVDEQYRSTEDEWVGVSGRVRAVTYNTEAVTEEELPDSILDFTDPEWEGRIGWAPTNGSFQAFVTALRVLEGEDGAREWLEGMQANGAQQYENNIAIVEAVNAGEVDAGLVNHYYLFNLEEEGRVDQVANKYYTDGDPGALVNIAGVGIIETTDQPEDAARLVEFLLSTEAQEYFATETYEIPLVEGVEADPELPDLSSLEQPDIDLEQLDDLEGTLQLLQEVGLL